MFQKPSEDSKHSNISLTINKDEITGLVGPNGSGKSTLMNILGCLDRPTSGLYLLDGVDVGAMDDAELARIRKAEAEAAATVRLLPPSERAS
jgi:ABC-type lipoprotein export system ATPase subunit